MRVLIDSTVWIDLFRGKERLPAGAEQALAERRAVICPVIWIEIRAGYRGKRERQLIEWIHDHCPMLEFDDPTWQLATDLRRKAVSTGLNVPLADVLIVACAKRHGAELIHRDKHFPPLLAL